MTTDPKQILSDLRARAGLDPDAALIARAWPLFEQIRARGGVVVIKLDGERGPDDNGAYTVVVSGQRLFGDDFFRADGATPGSALLAVLERCVPRLWP